MNFQAAQLSESSFGYAKCPPSRPRELRVQRFWIKAHEDAELGRFTVPKGAALKKTSKPSGCLWLCPCHGRRPDGHDVVRRSLPENPDQLRTSFRP